MQLYFGIVLTPKACAKYESSHTSLTFLHFSLTGENVAKSVFYAASQAVYVSNSITSVDKIV